MAWIFFDKDSREVLIKSMNLEKGTWNRAKGWALLKALITFNSLDKKISENARYTVGAILNDA